MRVAVLGASGFVGTTLVEWLECKTSHSVVPFIHSSGNAWRLARKTRPLQQIDIMSERSLADSLQGFDCVVNCTRGSEEIMLEGLKKVLRVMVSTGGARFVHLSSVAVYGINPDGSASVESGKLVSRRSEYGEIKLQQDKLVIAAANRGIAATILCPPNITGPESPFLLGFVNEIRGGRFAFVNGGNHYTNVVDVRNLAYAIQCAMEADAAHPRRLFVTDQEGVTWKQLVESLQSTYDHDTTFENISSDSLLPTLDSQSPAFVKQLGRAFKQLSSSEVRKALSDDPLIARLFEKSKKIIRRLPCTLQAKLKRRLATSSVIPTQPKLRYNRKLLIDQVRNVKHSTALAEQLIRYKSVYSFDQSMRDFCDWLGFMEGVGEPDQLYMHLRR